MVPKAPEWSVIVCELSQPHLRGGRRLSSSMKSIRQICNFSKHGEAFEPSLWNGRRSIMGSCYLPTNCGRRIGVVSKIRSEQDRSIEGVSVKQTPQRCFQSFGHVPRTSNLAGGFMPILATCYSEDLCGSGEGAALCEEHFLFCETRKCTNDDAGQQAAGV